MLLGYEDSCSLESSGSSGTRDAEPSDPPTPQPAPGEMGTAGGMLLDLAVKRPAVRSKIKVTVRTLPAPRHLFPGDGVTPLQGRGRRVTKSPLGFLR